MEEEKEGKAEKMKKAEKVEGKVEENVETAEAVKAVKSVKTVKKGARQEKKQEEKIGEALMKVALGYQIAEVTEEYAEVNGELKLTKRKKTKKDVPPDLKAVQLLLSSGEGADYGQWSDEALQAEKKRLLLRIEKELADKAEKEKKTAVKSVDKQEDLEKSAGQVCDDGEKTENTVCKSEKTAADGISGSVMKKEACESEDNVEKSGESAAEDVKEDSVAAKPIKKPRPKPRKRVVRKK